MCAHFSMGTSGNRSSITYTENWDGNMVQQGSPRHAVAAPLSWMILLPHGHWKRELCQGVPPALSCPSWVWWDSPGW